MTTTTIAASAPPLPLPEDLTAVLKRMRMPYLRAAAPEVLATAKAQRWDPTEVLRVLLAGKTFESWREHDSSIPVPTQSALATLEWVHRAENLAISGPSGTGKTHCETRPQALKP